MTLSSVRTRYLMSLEIEGSVPLELGETPYGRRRVVPITGGRASGSKVSGTVLPVGGDSAIIRNDGVFEHDVWLVIESHEGEHIRLTYRGRWHANDGELDRLLRREGAASHDHYLRTAIFFETSSPRYSWLNRAVAIGVGSPVMGTSSSIRYEVFEVL